MFAGAGVRRFCWKLARLEYFFLRSWGGWGGVPRFRGGGGRIRFEFRCGSLVLIFMQEAGDWRF